MEHSEVVMFEEPLRQAAARRRELLEAERRGRCRNRRRRPRIARKFLHWIAMRLAA